MNQEKCGRCQDEICVRRCYFGALSLEEGVLKKDEELCTGCGMCFHVCCDEAVELIAKKEGREQ